MIEQIYTEPEYKAIDGNGNSLERTVLLTKFYGSSK